MLIACVQDTGANPRAEIDIGECPWQPGRQANHSPLQVGLDTEETLVPDAQVLGVRPALQVGPRKPWRGFAGMRVRVEVLRQSADYATSECDFAHVHEQPPGKFGLPQLDHALDRDAVEPGPDGTVMVGRVLVIVPGRHVVWMKAGIALVSISNAPRIDEALPDLPGHARDIGPVVPATAG